MKKASVTRTYGPIHFEDLEPHRFEDLVRELIYDYKDWQSIEATGRAGSDEGFDIRAYERVFQNYNDSESESEQDETPSTHPMDGNLWMIQCKREKSIGPQKVAKIIKETVNPNSPPYGYILVASAVFSKKFYDAFREGLKKAGVMEFYLWGNAELEDMLHMPKYDRILFTFFGISLVTKKRTRTSEIRSLVTIKNKLYKVLGEENIGHHEILIRDINDNLYPREKEYADFHLRPRWGKYYFKGNNVYGIWVQLRMHYGFYNARLKEWDMFEGFDSSMIYDEFETEEERLENMKNNLAVRNFWERFPFSSQVEISVWALLKYEQILLVDDKGGPIHKIPHIYADYRFEHGPFSRIIHVIGDGNNIKFLEREGATRISLFPKTLSAPKSGKVHKNKIILISGDNKPNDRNAYGKYSVYDQNGKYDFLNPGDVIVLKSEQNSDDQIKVKLSCKYSIKIKDYCEEAQNHYLVQQEIFQQLKKQAGEDEIMDVYEFVYHYDVD
ncbi:PDDEXK family nuclease [Lacibacter sediminis]|uniref:Restriction endonuclease n=1 Tax=Lacibacter sediminis TaxID=2760713 RepID=A0A7G5XB26_9BACT|nr:restriction endonuclease [Lacibacter sediminis]QNA42679.1 restriction endonuclease [Lacibacter sediminis]